MTEHLLAMNVVRSCCGGAGVSTQWGDRRTITPRIDLSDAIRHVSMHVWPTKHHDVWRWNLQQLAARWSLFNGRKILAVAYDARSHFPDEVIAESARLGMTWDKVIARRNTTKIGEVKTWVLRMEELHPDTAGENEVVFACHGKGVRHDPGVVMPWTTVMYESCLDNWELVREHLEHYVMTGAFQQVRNVQWEYTGSFYWFRLAEIGRRNWRYIEQHYGGTETWPATQCRQEEASCLFGDNAGVLYGTQDHWYERWQARKAAFARLPARVAARSQIGTRLKERFSAWAGEHPCDDCRRAIELLNQMTPDEVASRREQIVQDIASRSQEQAAGWLLKLAVKADSVTGGRGTTYFIGRCVDEAIAAERSECGIKPPE